MTPQDHNKVIGIMHLIWGGFHAVIAFFIVPIFLSGLGDIGPPAPPEARLMLSLIALSVGIISLVSTTSSLVAAYALLNRKSWAKAAGIVAACFTALNMPFGTALTVYTLWFLWGQQGEQMYGKGASAYEGWRPSLRDGSAFDWEAQRAAEARRRKDEYVPPPQPPDWRS